MALRLATHCRLWRRTLQEHANREGEKKTDENDR